MNTNINELELVLRINWEEMKYPPVIDKNSFSLVLFRTTVLFRKVIEEMSDALLYCDDGVNQAITDYITYFDFLEKQVQQTRRMLTNKRKGN